MKIEIPDELFNDEERENTPKRIAKFYTELKQRHNFKFTCFPNEPKTTGMIILRNINFTSLCSHHLLPFEGVAHIGYIPDKVRCGISKLARVVDKFASKPNTQEIMTYEIIQFLEKELQPLGLVVIIIGKHQCMACRGVKKHQSQMITSEVRGKFLKHEEGKDPKGEFFQLLGVR